MKHLLVPAVMLLVGGGLSAQELGRIAMEKNPAVEASNAFACDLFKKLDGANKGKNLFFSPYSISSALAMTLEGARGDTALEMGQVLRLPANLRQQQPNQPWLAGAYGQGFADVTRKLTSGDPAKAAQIRTKVAEMRTQLANLNNQIDAAQRQGKFQTVGPLSQQANQLAASINALASQVDQFDLRIANALWGEKTYPFRKEYLDEVDRSFGSGHLRLADFRTNYPAERATINRWVEEQTNNRIKDLLPELTPEEARLLSLVLINAIYFKGEWSQPFDEKQTRQEDFLLAGGGKAKAMMMHHVNKDARYAAFHGNGNPFDTPVMLGIDAKAETYPGNDGFLLAELPVKGDKLSMVLIAPRSVDGLPAIEAKLTGETLAGWLRQLKKRSVQMVMPRFKLETDYKLGDTLKEMGMRKAFTERVADFTAMSTSSDPDDRLYISKVLHKAFVEVNEKGAEAAAATAVMMARPTSAPAAFPFTPEFRADRPFLFLIRDMDSGMILFLGRIQQPG